ncbi:hypothetical protein HK096_003031, partial [Nowakowskiella sp. JEL0078]
MATTALSFSKDAVLPPISRGNENGDLKLENVFNIVDDQSFSSKLTNVEAQRIMAVLQEAQRKVNLISLIPEHMDRRVQSIFPFDTIAIMTEHKQLEHRYKSLIESREFDKSVTDHSECIKQLRTSTRSIYRHFLQNPNAMSKLRYLKSTKLAIVNQFEQLLQEVKMLVYERLRTTVEEEKSKQDQLSVIIAKEQKTSNEVKALQEELEKAKRERSNEISKKNDIIRHELRDIKQQAEETTKRLETRSKQKEDMDLQQFKDKETTLRHEISNLKTQLQENTKKNREDEAQLRKKKFKIESEVENWIHKYDQDMEEKQTEIEDITVRVSKINTNVVVILFNAKAIFMEEKSQLDDLQYRFGDLQKSYEMILEERRIKTEQKK